MSSGSSFDSFAPSHWSLQAESPPPTTDDGQERVSTGLTITDQDAQEEPDGRKYSTWMPGEYSLPIDGAEQDRQDFNHAIYKMIYSGGLAAAPVDEAVHVLDIGTGTGIWAIEFAEAYPHSQVVGTDLSLIQPSPRTPNCSFCQENSETQDWMHGHLFDYIHLRSMGPCFSDIRTVIAKSFDNLEPGGWIELVDGHWEIADIDGSSRGTAIERWLKHLIEGGRRVGRDMTKAKLYKQHLEQAGFVDVVQVEVAIPGSPWPKDPNMRILGRYLQAAIQSALDSYRKIILASGLTNAEVDELTAQVELDLVNMDIHWYLPAYIVYGRKPHPNEQPESKDVTMAESTS